MRERPVHYGAEADLLAVKDVQEGQIAVADDTRRAFIYTAGPGWVRLLPGGGTAGQTLTIQAASNTPAWAPVGTVTLTVLTTVGGDTYFVPPGVIAIRVRVQAAGGGGGGTGASANANSNSGGGGAGEYREMMIINPAASYPYTCTLGGAGGNAGGNGSNAADTTFGTGPLITASGGRGGSGVNAPGVGGTPGALSSFGTGGDWTAHGGSGFTGSGGAALSRGADSKLGSGGIAGAPTGGVGDQGGGGGGSNGANQPGGDGGSSIIIVEEYWG